MSFGLKTITIFAPATVANVAVGFDFLGFAFGAVGDEVTVSVTEEPGVRLVGMEGAGLPTEPRNNAATAGLLDLAYDLKLETGFEVSLKKGIPIGSGMGGSAASSVGAVVAANALLENSLSKEKLLRYALKGEEVAAGAGHPDNAAACLFGGLTLACSVDPIEVIPLPVPPSILCVLVHPELRLDTRASRAALKTDIPLAAHVEQSSLLAGFIAGCYRGEMSLIRRCLKDLVIEPQRAHLVEGFSDVKHAAIHAGAMGCSLSGSGPSVFAWVDTMSAAGKVKEAMMAAFKNVGVASQGWIAPIGVEGARKVR